MVEKQAKVEIQTTFIQSELTMMLYSICIIIGDNS